MTVKSGEMVRRVIRAATGEEYGDGEVVTDVVVGWADHEPSADDPTLTVHWNHALDVTANHTEAVRQFVKKMEWGGRWVVGSGRDGYIGVWTGWVR